MLVVGGVQCVVNQSFPLFRLLLFCCLMYFVLNNVVRSWILEISFPSILRCTFPYKTAHKLQASD